MSENKLDSCARCKNTVKTGLKCIKCGKLSHVCCLKLLKNVRFLKNDTVICCPEASEVAKSSQKVADLSEDEQSKSGEVQVIEDLTEKITIKFLEELNKQKDQTIENQNIAIKALKDQVLLLNEKIEQLSQSFSSSSSQRKISAPVETISNNSKLNKQLVQLPSTSRTPLFTNNIVGNALHTAHTLQACEQIIHLNDNVNGNLPFKTQRRNLIVGTQQNSDDHKLKAAPFKPKAPSLFFYHATYFDVDVTVEDLTSHLVKYAPNVEVEKLRSRNPDDYASFKITVPSSEAQALMDSSLWPYRVVVNRFFLGKRNFNREK